MLIPSIDLMNGKAVQLEQGKKERKKLEMRNPINIARKFSNLFELQVIDLDSAFGKGNNFDLIRKICKIADCRIGGGIRTIRRAEQLIQVGAKKVIIGTKANKEFLKELINRIGKEKIIVALDARKGKLAIKGWKKQTNKDIFELAKELENYCSEFLYTCIEKEGLMRGGDFETVKKLKKITKNKITFAGGISKIEEIKEFDSVGVDCVVGMAVYTGKINPEKAFTDCLNWKKMKGLIPTIVKDNQGNVLTLAYSSKESLRQAIKEKKGVYFSRERKKTWIKSESSGNTQKLLKILVDCDNDALIFIVKQKGKACHLKRYSCFKEEKQYDIGSLYEIIEKRIRTKKKNSYSYKLYKNPKLLRKKIIEEARELVNTKNKNQVIWEASDLIYFILAFLAKRDVKLEKVYKKLEERNNGRKK